MTQNYQKWVSHFQSFTSLRAMVIFFFNLYVSAGELHSYSHCLEFTAILGEKLW